MFIPIAKAGPTLRPTRRVDELDKSFLEGSVFFFSKVRFLAKQILKGGNFAFLSNYPPLTRIYESHIEYNETEEESAYAFI